MGNRPIANIAAKKSQRGFSVAIVAKGFKLHFDLQKASRIVLFTGKILSY